MESVRVADVLFLGCLGHYWRLIGDIQFGKAQATIKRTIRHRWWRWRVGAFRVADESELDAAGRLSSAKNGAAHVVLLLEHSRCRSSGLRPPLLATHAGSMSRVLVCLIRFTSTEGEITMNDRLSPPHHRPAAKVLPQFMSCPFARSLITRRECCATIGRVMRVCCSPVQTPISPPAGLAGYSVQRSSPTLG